jgi:dGTPase
VVHARAFRRLENKTQVFTPGVSDHFRNRLTHTIEVSQIARTVGGVLGLDEDLTEALSLAHDIGHRELRKSVCYVSRAEPDV